MHLPDLWMCFSHPVLLKHCKLYFGCCMIPLTIYKFLISSLAHWGSFSKESTEMLSNWLYIISSECKGTLNIKYHCFEPETVWLIYPLITRTSFQQIWSVLKVTYWQSLETRITFRSWTPRSPWPAIAPLLSFGSFQTWRSWWPCWTW